MGLYNITGWSAGGRRPLTYNLKAGQFRGMGGVNVMPGPRNIVNIYNDGYGSYGSDDCGPKMPKWMQWMMGGGMIMNFLGQILTSIFPNHSYRGVSNPPSDGRGSTVTDSQMQNLTILRDTYSRDCTISDPLPDGTVIITGKNTVNGKYPRVSCKLDDLQTKLAELYDANGTENTEETGDKPSKDLINLAKGLGIDTNGKTAQELSDEIKNRTNPSTTTTHTQPATTATTSTAGTVAQPTEGTTVPRLFNDTTMANLRTESDVLNAFKNATGAEAVKLGANTGDITIIAAYDQGNRTYYNSSTDDSHFKITQDQINSIISANGTPVNLGTFAGKPAKGESLDGYLKITVGTQTYIVGKKGDDYMGYQFENGNVIGYNEANWKRT